MAPRGTIASLSLRETLLTRTSSLLPCRASRVAVVGAEHDSHPQREGGRGSLLPRVAFEARALADSPRRGGVSSKATFSERPGDPRPSGARERS